MYLTAALAFFKHHPLHFSHEVVQCSLFISPIIIDIASRLFPVEFLNLGP